MFLEEKDLTASVLWQHIAVPRKMIQVHELRTKELGPKEGRVLGRGHLF